MSQTVLANSAEAFTAESASVSPATPPASAPAQPSVSVVTVSYWTGPLLARSVLSALRQPEVLEVIIVDNGNWSHEIDRLTSLAGDEVAKLRIITGHGNIGYAAGCNKGARVAKGAHLFMLNPDAILPDHAVRDLLQEAEALEGDWVLGGKLVNPDGTEQAGSRRRPLTPWSAFVEMTKLYRVAPRHPYFRRFNAHQEPCPEDLTEMPVISGACMLMPTQSYRNVRGMDESYFLHVEDVDFCLRMRKMGGTVYFAPNTDILHFKSSSRTNRVRVEARKARSMVHYFWSHFRDDYPKAFLVLVSALVWIGTGLRAAKIIAQRALALIGIRARIGKSGLRKAAKLQNRTMTR